MLIWLVSFVMTHYQYEFCKPWVNIDCFNVVLTQLSFPSWTTAVVSGFVALIALNHRSEQTNQQIVESNRLNNFNIHIKHREEFIKYINQRTYSYLSIEKTGHALYQLHFPNSVNGDIRLSDDIKNELHEIACDMVSWFNGLQEKSYAQSKEALKLNFEKRLSRIGFKFDIYKAHNSGMLKFADGTPQVSWKSVMFLPLSMIKDLDYVTAFSSESDDWKFKKDQLQGLLKFKEFKSPTHQDNREMIIESEDKGMTPEQFEFILGQSFNKS